MGEGGGASVDKKLFPIKRHYKLLSYVCFVRSHKVTFKKNCII